MYVCKTTGKKPTYVSVKCNISNDLYSSNANVVANNVILSSLESLHLSPWKDKKINVVKIFQSFLGLKTEIIKNHRVNGNTIHTHTTQKKTHWRWRTRQGKNKTIMQKDALVFFFCLLLFVLVMKKDVAIENF